jgi:type I restriction enzyme S subunit
VSDHSGQIHASRTKGRAATQGVIPGRFALSVGAPKLPCPRGWRWTALSEVAQLESGHTPSRKHPEYWDEGIPWIGIKDAVESHGHTIQDTFQHVSALGLENSSARLLPPRTVCLSRTASVGYVVVMGRSMATSQDFVNWVCGPKLEPDYLKYVLVAERESLLRFASGTTHQTIYYPEAKAFHVLLPPIEQQREILRTLCPIDEKIELNRHENETLKALAQTLFRSWFVDFDPVRSKMDGRPPSMDATIARLFPDCLVETALGALPRGWPTVLLESLVSLDKGVSYKGDFLSDSGVPMINLGCFKGDGVFDMAKVKGYAGEAREAHWVSTGDLVLANTDMTQDRIVIGSPAIVPRHADNRFLFSHHVYAARFPSGATPGLLSYIYYTLLRPEFRARAAGFATGTTVLALPRDAVLSLSVVLPPEKILEHFGEFASKMHALAEQNEVESRTLMQTLNEILPRLLAGELRISEAQRSVEKIM